MYVSMLSVCGQVQFILVLDKCSIHKMISTLLIVFTNELFEQQLPYTHLRHPEK